MESYEVFRLFVFAAQNLNCAASELSGNSAAIAIAPLGSRSPSGASDWLTAAHFFLGREMG